jgi:hypothetical protein
MTRLVTIAAALCAAFGTCAFTSENTVSAPESGTYNAQVYIQSADSGCLDKAGFVFIGEASFAGLGGATHYLRIPETGSNLAIVSVQTLTVTSGKGTTHLNGKLVWTGNGFGESWNYSGTFSATVTEIGTHAFVMQMKESYTGCTEEDSNISLVRIGADQ